jgi:serine/threonine protein kinase
MSDDSEDVRRRTKLYGAIDPNDLYPRTVVDSGVVFSQSPQIGESLARYRIEHLLGRGGMGEVFSARDDRIGRSVAIKRLRIDQAGGDTRARFLREAVIQGRLEHPAVVPVHELCETDEGQAFFVMKQVSGTVLADVLPKLAYGDPEIIERFPRQLLLRAFVEVCLAVEFAHARGVIHRDLKPANIALGDYGEVYVLDWGIARVVGTDDGARRSFGDIDTASGTETLEGAILGTPGYISREQISGDDVDHRTDVYALGCILFEILALQPLHPRGQPGIASALAGIDAKASVRAPERDVPPELDRSARPRPHSIAITARPRRASSAMRSSASSTATVTSRCASSSPSASCAPHTARSPPAMGPTSVARRCGPLHARSRWTRRAASPRIWSAG